MKRQKLIFAAMSLLFSSFASAENWIVDDTYGLNPWTITGSIGGSQTSGMFRQDGQSAVGRLSFGITLYPMETMQLGFELGLQSGNQMRLFIPKDDLEILGGVAVQGTINPMVDALLTARIPISNTLPVTLLLKAGGVYRQMRMDRAEVNDLSKFNFEAQAGCEFKLSEHLAVVAAYQQIFGGNVNVQIDPMTATGHIQNIPTSRAVLIGLSVTF